MGREKREEKEKGRNRKMVEKKVNENLKLIGRFQLFRLGTFSQAGSERRGRVKNAKESFSYSRK